jgi:hypothetical protein
VGLTKVVPFLVEDELKAKGGHFSKTEDWGVHVVSDGLLITGRTQPHQGLRRKCFSIVLVSPVGAERFACPLEQVCVRELGSGFQKLGGRAFQGNLQDRCAGWDSGGDGQSPLHSGRGKVAGASR